MKLRTVTAPDGKPVTFQLVPFPKIAQGVIWGATADPEELENEANRNAARYYRRYVLRML